MAAAVSNEAALGFLGLGASSVEQAREMIRETKHLTRKPFGVNVFTHKPAVADLARETEWLRWLEPHFAKFNARPPASLREIYTSFVADKAMLDLLVAEKPAVVSFHFGLPSVEFIAALRSAGIVLMATATNLAEAKQICRHDIAAVVAQGIEAGGHRGTFDPDTEDECLGTLALTRLLVRMLDRPVVAAGGIMDGAGIAAALALGAQAAQLGTAFVSCAESSIDQGYRRAIVDPNARTTFTDAISGRRARGLENAFTALGRDPSRPATPSYPIAYDAGKALHTAAKKQGFYGFGAQWAGQGALLSRPMPAAKLVSTLEAELTAAAGSAARAF